MHINFLLGSPRGGGGLNTLNPPPPRSATEGSCGNVMIVYYECGGDNDSDSDNADGDN